MQNIFLTPAGKKELEEKLNNLKTVRRQEISEKIKTARGFGDISENAEYDAAKDEQAMVEGEILDIENKLRTAVIINEVTDTSKVSIGSKVKLLNIKTNASLTYQIVGITESDPFNNRISNESPIGKGALGRTKNETFEIMTPNKEKIKFKILEISR